MLPFNLNSYRALLQRASQSGYRFIGFHEVAPHPAFDAASDTPSETELQPNPLLIDLSARGGRCLLRHDVDADLPAAVAMARAEYELGIRATYFLMWRSPCYNLMSRSVQTFAESILAMGHHVGLHYDQGFDAMRKITPVGTARQVKQQSDWLEELLGSPVHAVSFHQPTTALLQAGVDCGDRINTYDKERLQHFRYISDSNRVFPLWQSGRKIANDDLTMALAICYPDNIQLLIHPMWWVYDDPSTEAVWERALMNSIEHMQAQLLDTERAYGARRAININRHLRK